MVVLGELGFGVLICLIWGYFIATFPRFPPVFLIVSSLASGQELHCNNFLGCRRRIASAMPNLIRQPVSARASAVCVSILRNIDKPSPHARLCVWKSLRSSDPWNTRAYRPSSRITRKPWKSSRKSSDAEPCFLRLNCGL